MLLKLLQITFLFSFLGNSFAVVSPLQTGQHNSYAPLDDGDLQKGLEWPTERFTDHKDGTLTDNLTGLMWLKDAFCADHYISGASTNDWHQVFEFAIALNNNSLHSKCKEYSADYQDWRIPNINELASLMRAGLNQQTSIAQWLTLPGSESGAFSGTVLTGNPIWTSNTFAGNPSQQAWIANLETGGASITEKSSINSRAFIFSAVRSTATNKLVSTGQIYSYINQDDGDLRTGHSPTYPRFILRNDRTVIDKATGLIWMQDAGCANQGETDWQSAMTIFNSSPAQELLKSNCLLNNSLHNELSWRMPNINELRSLLNYGNAYPALDSTHPFSLSVNQNFWSSTSSNTAPDNNAWIVSISTGEFYSNANKFNIAHTWAVSGPINFADIVTNRTGIDFGRVFLNSGTVSESITITNNGSDSLFLNNISINSSKLDSNNNFFISEDNCSKNGFLSGQSCSLTISYSPNNNQITENTLIISSNALGRESLEIPLKVSYLSDSTDANNPACFIATAAYGSPLAPEINTLRKFRNKVLLHSDWGKSLVTFYYKVSPSIADYIASHEIAKVITRILLHPIIFSITHPIIAILLMLFGFLTGIILVSVLVKKICFT